MEDTGTGRGPDRAGNALVIIAVLLAVAFMKLAAPLFVPLVISLVLSFAFAPAVNFLSKKGIPHALSVLVSAVFGAGLVWLFGSLCYTGILRLMEGYPFYRDRLVDICAVALRGMGLDAEPIMRSDFSGDIARMIMGLYGQTLDIAFNALAIFFLTVFFLLEGHDIIMKTERVFNLGTSMKLLFMIEDIYGRVANYLSLKLGLSVLSGLAVWGGLAFFRVDFPEVWGMIAGLLYTLPFIGFPLVAIGAGAVALVEFWPSPDAFLQAIAVVTFVGIVVPSLVDPALSAGRLSMSMSYTFASLLFWGWLWGIVGMFLAVPLASALKIVISNLDATSRYAPLFEPPDPKPGKRPRETK